MTLRTSTARGRKTLANAFKDASKGKNLSMREQRSADTYSSTAGSHSDSSSHVSSSPKPYHESRISEQPVNARAAVEAAVRDATVSKTLEDLQTLRNTSNSRGPMLDLMDRYYVADGSALHQAKLYTAISGLLSPTALFDFAVSATA